MLRNLISQVYIRRPLWYEDDEDYRNAELRGKLWDEVSRAVNMSSYRAESEWLQLQQRFQEENKKGNSGITYISPTWPYYHDVCFLLANQPKLHISTLHSCIHEVPSPSRTLPAQPEESVTPFFLVSDESSSEITSEEEQEDTDEGDH